MTTIDQQSLYTKFGRAYAEAVLEFLSTGQVQSIDFDAELQDYVYGTIEEGTSPEDVGAWVGEQWGYLTGPLLAVENPAAPGFSAKALWAEIQQSALESPLMAEMALKVAGEAESAEFYNAPAGSIRSQ